MKNEKGFAQAKEVWDERFRREGFLFGEEPNQYLVSQASKLTKGRALLIADGEGRNSGWCWHCDVLVCWHVKASSSVILYCCSIEF